MKVKKRESFRPFAPSILLEDVSGFFDFSSSSPFMLLTANVKPSKKPQIPAVIHIDETSRLQTVTKKQNGIYYDLINEFKRLTGVPVLLNTSFNLGGEPIVETPADAIHCFANVDIDYLVIDRFLIRKKK